MSLASIAVMTQDRTLVQRLEANCCEPTQVIRMDDSRSLEELLQKSASEMIVLDLRIPSRGGHLEDRLIERLKTNYPGSQVILLTTEPCPTSLEKRVKQPGISRLREPVDITKLVDILAGIPNDNDIIDQDSRLEDFRSEPQNRLEVIGRHDDQFRRRSDDIHVQQTIGKQSRFETNTPAMQRMLTELEIAANHDVSILLIGETGSGKTYLAQWIHENSPRKQHLFLPVGCGALPSELIESELFGHVRGAFTSAHANKDGKFLVAGEGTILLDEIDVLGIEQQVKLLRVIETGQFEPVGSNTTLHSQSRVIVASNRHLEPLVEQGRFRPDLYYRLNMLKFEIPPLRRRRSDIIPLAKTFIEQLSERHNVAVNKIEAAFFDRLLRYPWPGNVRELENVIQRSIIYCRDSVLKESHLPTHILTGKAGPANDINGDVPASPMASGDTSAKLGAHVASTEQDVIEQALLANKNCRTSTAKQLGISRVTLYNKMKKYGIANYKVAST